MSVSCLDGCIAHSKNLAREVLSGSFPRKKEILRPTRPFGSMWSAVSLRTKHFKRPEREPDGVLGLKQKS